MSAQAEQALLLAETALSTAMEALATACDAETVAAEGARLAQVAYAAAEAAHEHAKQVRGLVRDTDGCPVLSSGGTSVRRAAEHARPAANR